MMVLIGKMSTMGQRLSIECVSIDWVKHYVPIA